MIINEKHRGHMATQSKSAGKRKRAIVVGECVTLTQSCGQEIKRFSLTGDVGYPNEAAVTDRSFQAQEWVEQQQQLD